MLCVTSGPTDPHDLLDRLLDVVCVSEQADDVVAVGSHAHQRHVAAVLDPRVLEEQSRLFGPLSC